MDKFADYYHECEIRENWLAKKLGPLAVAASTLGGTNAEPAKSMPDKSAVLQHDQSAIPLDPTKPKAEGQPATALMVPAEKPGRYVVCWRDGTPVKIDGKPYTVPVRFISPPAQDAKPVTIQGIIRIRPNGQWYIGDAKILDADNPAATTRVAPGRPASTTNDPKRPHDAFKPGDVRARPSSPTRP